MCTAATAAETNKKAKTAVNLKNIGPKCGVLLDGPRSVYITVDVFDRSVSFISLPSLLVLSYDGRKCVCLSVCKCVRKFTLTVDKSIIHGVPGEQSPRMQSVRNYTTNEAEQRYCGAYRSMNDDGAVCSNC